MYMMFPLIVTNWVLIKRVIVHAKANYTMLNEINRLKVHTFKSDAFPLTSLLLYPTRNHLVIIRHFADYGVYN